MGTEKNQANAAPIPAPPVTPAVPGPPMPAGAGVVFTPVSAQGKKRMKLIGVLVGVGGFSRVAAARIGVGVILPHGV